jgi:CRP-like cAMP-binding protein
MKYKLCRCMRYQTFAESELVFRKGDPSELFYFILKGSIGLYEGFR